MTDDTSRAVMVTHKKALLLLFVCVRSNGSVIGSRGFVSMRASPPTSFFPPLGRISSSAAASFIMPVPDSDDPFACFDNNEADTTKDSVPSTSSQQIRRRDQECGVLAFHAGTEQSLLTHVQNELASEDQQTPECVLRTIDKFCMERHWMMHCGPEKATILKDFVKHCIVATDKTVPLTVVELGTYCGYSSIMLCQTLLQIPELSSFHIYTVEVDSQNAKVAEQMIQLAKVDVYITVLRLDIQGTDLSELLQSTIGVRGIDFLFLDHDKQSYLSDLKRLEVAGFVRSGTHVAADNVVFHEIDNYRTYVKQLADKGVVKTKLVESMLEYSEPDTNASTKAKLRDGIGE